MIFAILISKIVIFVLRLLRRGASTLPGRVALALSPNLLSKLSKDINIICVTGTNGKTTTCAMLRGALDDNGIKCFSNNTGANMLTGVATSFVANCNVFGKIKHTYAVLECDENSLPQITSYIKPDILLVTNIFRDQLDRYGEVNFVLSRIKQGISNIPSPHLVINADCPLSSTITGSDVTTFGIDVDYDLNTVSDTCYCPVCSSKLSYLSTVYAHLGTFRCSRCGYHRVAPNYSVTRISDSTITINDDTIPVNIDGIYNAYNLLSAYAVLKRIGISNVSALSTFTGAFGRIESFSFGDKTIKLFLVKNPVGYSSCIDIVKSYQKCDIIFALNDNPADGIDVSWIWDVDFIPLSAVALSCYTIGTRSLDMAVRLKYAGISSNSIIGESYDKMINIIKSSSSNVVIFSTYTSMMNMRHLLVDEFGGKEFWQ